jgi:Protein of unknown function (DUF2939)
MIRFVFRHFTGLLIIVAVGAWAIFYLPNTPTWAVLRLKQAIDARNGDAAARYVDFQNVVKNAGYEMVQQRSADNPLGTMVGRAAVELLSQPMAGLLEAWAKDEVNKGNRDLQMPDAAVAASLFVLHRDGDTAYTKFTDRKGQTWEIQLARAPGGFWQIVEVKNVEQLLEKLKQREQQRLQNAP